jgi:hypothetical protein
VLVSSSAAAAAVCLQRIQFARTKSDAVAKLDGSYKPDKERSKKSAAARGAGLCMCKLQRQQRQQQQQQHIAGITVTARGSSAVLVLAVPSCMMQHTIAICL